MKMMLQTLLALVAALMFSSAYADTKPISWCIIPETIPVPDGATVTEEEMLAGQERVKQYIANLDAYRNCIEAEEAAIGEEQTDEERATYNQMY
ncbi:uncharacterized protein METZ01_LOCUS345572, partial [marine metagenome]